MFIDTRERPAGEVQQKVGRLKLSEAIRIGAERLPDIAKKRGGWCSCAIGLAHYAVTGRVFPIFHYECGSVVEEWATEHGFDPIHARQAERMFNNGSSVSNVADWLESQGL